MPSEDSDSRSLIRIFTGRNAKADLNLRWAHICIGKVEMFVRADNEDSDQSARVRRLI